MDDSLSDRLARSLDMLRTRRATTALLGGLLTGPILAQGDAEARPKKKHKKRRGPENQARDCKHRCSKKRSKQARRRCHRRCHAATPGPESCPTDGTEVVVASYTEVKDDFARGRALALPTGPDAVANFVNERFTDLYDQFSTEIQTLISPDDLADFSYRLQHNRVHFEVPSSLGIFDGYFEGDTIEGYFTQIFTISFWITATTPIPQGSDNPLEGRWEGQIYDPTGILYQTPFDIVVTFTTVSGELTGTLDVLGVIENIPITDISVSESRPLSAEPSGELRIIPALNATQYSTLVGWGNADLAFRFFIDPQGVVIGINISPDWPLPPDPASTLAVETIIRLPFDGVWWVNTGGPRQYENHHVTDPGQRHAYDFDIWNVRDIGKPDLEENADFWAWEQPIFAPAAGTVITMTNDVPDNLPGVVDTSTPGNVIVLQTAPSEFLLMGHLRQGSVAVTVGEQVQEGQFLARVGNSGYSTVPHLHMHLLDRPPYPFDPEAVSLPFRFKDLLVNGKRAINPSPVFGDFVQHAGCPTPVPAAYAAPPDRDRSSRARRGGTDQPMMTRRSAEWLLSPAARPVDGCLLLPGEKP